MTTRISAPLVAAAALLTMGQAPAPTSAPAPAPGYLPPGAFDTTPILPPLPAAGSIRDEADKAIFRETRKLEGSARWVQAQDDVEYRNMLKTFACALGAELTPQTAPKTGALLARMSPDISRAVTGPKDLYKHPRPYQRQAGPICVADGDRLGKSYDYPSGHVTISWAVGLVLAELAPDRAVPILTRARTFGDSRLVCGVHSLSAVEEGRTNGAAVVAALHGQPEFRQDLEAARAELAAVRSTAPAPDPAVCARTAAGMALTPY